VDERAGNREFRKRYPPSPEADPHGSLVPPPRNGPLLDLLDALSSAARRGHDQLLKKVEELLPQQLDVRSARLVVRDSNEWRLWSDSALNGTAHLGSLEGAHRADDERTFILPDGTVLLMIRPDDIGLVVSPMEGYPIPEADLAICARYLEAAIAGLRAAPVETLRQNIISAFSHVATTILHSEDLPEIFFNITEVAKSELAADISGIMLLENERLVMQRCVGNESPETSRLEIEAGQGVGGRVLQTGGSCVVENYVASSHISRDFFNLARAEKVRSALAVPVMSKDQIIGVLEVWRRRPSTFSEENVTTLETLADLTSIAIANVSLIEAQKQTLHELERANSTIQKRYDVIERSAGFQKSLMQCVLNDLELDGIVRSAADELESSLFIFDAETGLRAQSGRYHLTRREVGKLRVELAKAPWDETEPMQFTLSDDGPTVLCQRISAVSAQRGWVGIVEPAGSREWNLLALASISITVALHDMKSHAASSALSEKISTLLWDLIDAPQSIRKLATDRLRELGIDLNRESCIVLCGIRHADVASEQSSLSDRNFDIYRWLVRDVSARRRGSQGEALLASMRGTEIAIVMPWSNTEAAVSLAEDIERQVAAIMPGVRCCTGISAKCDDPLMLMESLSQARLAGKVAEMTNSTRPVLFEETGLIGIMIGIREGMQFEGLATNTLKGLADESQPQAATLRKTLHCFLSLNCHQGHTAEALGVHPKTVAYRLEKIECATGLDLKCHEHRLLLEIALKYYDLGLEVL